MSHHLDTPLASQTGQLYIDDLYVFPGEGSTVLVMDVNSNVNGLFSEPGFHSRRAMASRALRRSGLRGPHLPGGASASRPRRGVAPAAVYARYRRPGARRLRRRRTRAGGLDRRGGQRGRRPYLGRTHR